MHKHPTKEWLTFDNPAELARFWRDKGRQHPRVQSTGLDEPTCKSVYGETTAETLYKSEHGDMANYALAERMAAQYGLDIQTQSIAYAPSVAGGFPIIPEYLAGEPECMRSPMQARDNTGLVRIYADNGASAGASLDALNKRAACILALAISLSAVRPVELFVLDFCTGSSLMPDGSRAGAIVSRLDFQGSGLATAVYAVTSASYTRRLAYDCGFQHGPNANGYGWPRWNGDDMFGNHATDGGMFGKYYFQKCREFLELGPDDVLVPRFHAHDPDFKDPESWLVKTLARLTPELV